MTAEVAYEIALELFGAHGIKAVGIAERAADRLEAEGDAHRACVWRVLHAILGDIAARRITSPAPTTLH